MSNRKQFSSAWMTVAVAPGTGSVTLDAAVRMRTSFGKQTFLTFVQAGFVDGDTFSYKISDKTVGWEEGEGTYNAGVVSRDTVFRNSLGTTAKLSFTADARIAPVLLSEDIADKIGSADKATQEQAEAYTDDAVWLTPLKGKHLVRRFLEDNDNALDPRWFDVDITGATDSSDEINTMIAEMRSQQETSWQGRRWWIDGGGAYCRAEQPLNLTGFTVGRNWGMKNFNIRAFCTGKNVLDLNGSRYGAFRDFYIWGDQTNQPYNGIQLALGWNGTALLPCNHHKFSNVNVDGYFKNAALHNYGSEQHGYSDCRIWNRRVADGDGEAWAAIFDGAQHKTPISDFGSFPSATRRSFLINRLFNCSVQKPLGIAGPAVFIQDTAGLSFDRCYVTSGSEEAFRLRLTSWPMKDIVLDNQIETSGIDRIVKFTSDAAAAREIRSLTVRSPTPHISDEVFKIAAATGSDFTPTALKIIDLNMRIQEWNLGTPANGVFPEKSLVSLYGADIVLPALSDMGAMKDYAAFDGSIHEYGTGKSFYSALGGYNDDIVIADDAVLAIKPPGTFGVMIVSSAQSEVSAIVMFRTSAHGSGVLMQDIGSTLGSNVEVGTGTPTGTTGTDGKMSVFAGADGLLYIENRRGGPIGVQYTFLNQMI